MFSGLKPVVKILIVDDEKDILTMMETLLTKEGYKVYTAVNGEEAIEVMKREPEIDLVIMDIIMPKMDGITAAKYIKDMYPSKFIPIIFLTALVDYRMKLSALECGEEFLNKPIDLLELKVRVNNLLKLKSYRDHLEEMLEARTIELRKTLKELEEVHASLKEAQQEIIYRLALAAEYKDEDTANHLKRMSSYTLIIADRLGLSSEFKERLFLAVPMHDIGKIGVPDSILLKPGRLTPEEFEIIKLHPIIGAKILSNSSYELLKMAETIALTHHEKYNGRGYPMRLKGEQIPLVGRIAAVADVFDALTSKRPYKLPWPVEEAVKLIKEEAGKHFDPQVVDAFLQGLNDIKDAKSKYSD